ncbi:MAG TPA: DUF4214 domain-containing protein, partial [Pyrinomonadaceae bacterium]
AAISKGPGVYKSTDGGQTWANIYVSNFDTEISDIRVAISPANSLKLFVYSGGGSPRQLQVESMSPTGANVANSVNLASKIDPGQFNYNTYIAVDPGDANTLYVGSRDVFKSVDGGVNWINLTKNFAAPFKDYTPGVSTTHSDQQTLAFSPSGSQTILIGNDGGLFKSTDGGVTLKSLNDSLAITEFVGYAVDPNDANKSYGGTQDNGSLKRNGASVNWKEVDGGDGGNSVVDPLDTSIVYTTYINGSVTRFANSGDNGNGTEIGSNAIFGEDANSPRINFYPPFVGNGVSSTLYFGTWKLFVSQNHGDTWTTPGGATDLTRGGDDVLNAIGVQRSAFSASQTIYTGSRDGRVMVSSNGGANWTDATPAQLNGSTQAYRTPTSITVDATNAAVAYLTVSGFGSGHVFKTTNRGATWADISGNLPNIPANALLVDPTVPGILLLGTDIGVFRSANGGTSWENFSSGLPPTVVSKLVATKAGTIQAGTYGRGAYQLSAQPTGPNAIDDAQTFVRQHYLDFLAREPDAGGWGYWTDQIASCGSNATCVKDRRIGVSAAYFIELEFQATGSVVYRLYRAAFGSMAAPNQTRANVLFSQFMADRVQVVGGAQLAASTLSFANQFVQRTAFKAAYPDTLTSQQFVDKLYDTAGLTPFTAERSAAVAALNSNSKTRAQVLLDLIEVPAFKTREYNPSFVLMQYFGYLRRDPDQAGYDFWLGKVSTNYREMVCAFISSAEYQLRFGTTATQNDTDCANFK